MEKIRLQKYFSDCGIMSRRAAEAEITAGRVKVNGAVAGDHDGGWYGNWNGSTEANYTVTGSGLKTIYFQPGHQTPNDWGYNIHIYIADVASFAFMYESSASFNDNIRLNFYVDYKDA